ADHQQREGVRFREGNEAIAAVLDRVNLRVRREELVRRITGQVAERFGGELNVATNRNEEDEVVIVAISVVDHAELSKKVQKSLGNLVRGHRRRGQRASERGRAADIDRI